MRLRTALPLWAQAGFLILETGCAHPGFFSSALDPSRTLGPVTTIEQSRAYPRALHAESSSRALEQARIDYLLERVAKSPYNFIRNGSRYTGKRAEAHLRWKYFRNQGKVKTAEEFIDRVASSSKMSGQPYSVLYPDKKRYPLRPLLFRELEYFDQILATRRAQPRTSSRVPLNAE